MLNVIKHCKWLSIRHRKNAFLIAAVRIATDGLTGGLDSPCAGEVDGGIEIRLPHDVPVLIAEYFSENVFRK